MYLISTLVTAVCLLLVYLWFQRRPDRRLPPFPVRPLPILGNLLSMKHDMRPLFKAWRKQCGDIFILYLGRYPVVVLNGYDLIKEALVKHGDVFSDRPLVFLDQASGIPVKGIGFNSGPSWKEQREVTVSILRTFGMGKNLLADKILEEVTSFTTYLSSLKGKPTDIQIIVNVCVSNIICSILIGQRFHFDDKEFQYLMKTLKTLLSEAQNTGLVNFFPWLKYLPGDFFKAKRMVTWCKTVLSLFTRIIQRRERIDGDVEDTNNFIGAYLKEMKQRVQAGEPTFLDNESLLKIMLQLFQAGTETSSTTICWSILYMVVYPDIQEKVYQEIKEKVGTERVPTMQEKSQLVYLNAVIMETQRLASIIPTSVSHMCSEETTLRGYTIPKGAWILPNLDSVLHDKTTWGDDAMSFRPERFVDLNGKLKIPEEFIPFSIGRRVCLGEAMARMELFLFLSSMIQKFRFLPANPMETPSTDYIVGIVLSPVPFDVIILERDTVLK